jgi:murein L,D-transpeptidase YcbB/YkuD
MSRSVAAAALLSFATLGVVNGVVPLPGNMVFAQTVATNNADDKGEAKTLPQPGATGQPVVNPGVVPPQDIEIPKLEIAIPTEPPKVDVPKSNLATEESKAAAAARPDFALATEISDSLRRDRLSGVDREDRDAAARLYEQRQGEPIWLNSSGYLPEARALMAEIRLADDFGLRASDFRLPPAELRPGAAPSELADADVALSLAALKYARYARGGRLDPLQLSKNLDRKPQVYAPLSVLSELARAAHPDAYLRSLHPSHPQFERLRKKYNEARAGHIVIERVTPPADSVDQRTKKRVAAPLPAQPTPDSLRKKLLANMEMWRWMPAMGDSYIHNNIPEFTTRMVRGGKLVHQERIVTGKTDTQTPVFSAEMQTVVFQPFWNVPESIKWKELQPQLMRNGAALQRAGLKAAYNGREVDPETVDWASADMRAFHIFQPPGTANALGQVKFLFPNKHDVYMHDTPSKSLFNQSVRAFSHGCMRVRDPLKFAEMLLGEDQGWSMSRIVQTASAGPQNNEIRLKKRVPIHVTYFTAWVEEDGKLKTFSDIYGHENRINLGLEGKAHLIAQPKEEKYQPPRPGQAGVRFTQKSSPVETWIKNIFNF